MSKQPSSKSSPIDDLLMVIKYIPQLAGVDLRVEVFDCVGSTNDICQAKAAEGFSCDSTAYVAIASSQTKGRGRRGRSFASPDGSGIYMSILLRPENMLAEDATKLTTIAAVSVSRAIEDVCGVKAGIKWVNDIFVDGLKVCGILTEARLHEAPTAFADYAIVGIGINVFEPEGGFPEELQGVAGSILRSKKNFFNQVDNSSFHNSVRAQLASKVLEHFFHYYIAFCEHCESMNSLYLASNNLIHIDHTETNYDYLSCTTEYKKRCLVIGQDILVLKPNSSPLLARAIELDDDLRLLVRYDDGSEEWLDSGEISILPSFAAAEVGVGKYVGVE